MRAWAHPSKWRMRSSPDMDMAGLAGAGPDAVLAVGAARDWEGVVVQASSCEAEKL